MYSVNVPVPGRVSQIAADCWPLLVDFEGIRDRHTLVVKRFGTRSPDEYGALEREVRETLVGTPTFDARITGVDAFFDPPSGASPVVYLTVESPGLRSLHDRLVDRFGAVSGLEGDEYTPHVTLARGADHDAVDRLLDVEIEPTTWTVTNLVFWDAWREATVTTISLPA